MPFFRLQGNTLVDWIGGPGGGDIGSGIHPGEQTGGLVGLAAAAAAATAAVAAA